MAGIDTIHQLRQAEMGPCETPVLLLVFNRPEHTRRCLNAIAQASPRQLFVAADGPRNGNASDRIKCEQVLRMLEEIPWPCEVKSLVRTENLGCKHAVSSAIQWFFSHVDRGIILEDDCVADSTFFRFCGQLLDRYADDERVGVVTGNNFQRGIRRGEASYYFSKYNHCWGWATWRRAWKHFDVDLRFLTDLPVSTLVQQFACGKSEVAYWEQIFRRVRKGDIDTWDYQWMYCCWAQQFLTATPQVNLVENIGFGCDATHTQHKSGMELPKCLPIDFPLVHPATVEQCVEADRHVANAHFRVGLSLFARAHRAAGGLKERLFNRQSN